MKGLIIHTRKDIPTTIRTFKIKRFLEQYNHKVDLFDSSKIDFGWYYHLSLRIKNWIAQIKRKNYPLKEIIDLRAEILKKKINPENYDFFICESHLDAKLLSHIKNKLTIYDSPSPLTEELKYSGKFTENELKKLQEQENKIYENCTYVTFAWHSYVDYVKKNIYNGKNIFYLDFGCEISKKRCKFNKNPKIVHFGAINDYWCNPKLLSTLTKKMNIDIYATQKPKINIKLKKRGFIPIETLKDYQFGLVTISKDHLRKHGFSSKILSYISFGLPVLVPEWRNYKGELKGIIPYNEHNFLDKIKEYSNKRKWQKKSGEAYNQAKKLSWDKTLRPLLKILKEY